MRTYAWIAALVASSALGEGETGPPASPGRYALHKYSDNLQVVFDAATGRVYEVEDLESVRCIDPVAATVTTRPMTRVGDTPPETAPPGPGPDATTRVGAAQAVLDALTRGDAEGFRRMVTRRIQARHGEDFDEWFAVWRRECEGMNAEAFAERARWSLEDGVWKIDEN
ncbi:MAG: hypothetical protein HY722_09845 [Planctomycetes bacterium]|nr:hypothetical protein [Planctomycetota bacterium]